jgi:CheY-like chemotaxis protein/HPt (histidine-containing phosphotransfer) domain-containing protein
MLKKFGHTTDVAMNGTEVVEAANSKRYDVILMDIQMPEMDGTEATRLIRTFEATQGRHTPVVAMTAYAMVGDREKFIAADMDDYISKPISRERLREVLRGIIPNPASRESEGLPESLVDMALLEEQIEGDTELLRTLVSVFEEDQERLLHDLDAALSSGDAEGAETAAHTLKGALGVLGAQPVCELASQMEVAAQENRLDDCQAAHARLRDSVLSLNKELERLLDTL